MSPIWDNNTVRSAIFHPRVRETIREWPRPVRIELGQAIRALQIGVTLTMPLARAMPSVAKGVEELRIRDSSGQFRVFYLTRFKSGVLVFHAFAKKTRKTPKHEIALARTRLKEMQQ
jgi:phage-related protein